MGTATDAAGASGTGASARLARNILAALVVSLSAVSFYISAASLLFQGALAPHLSVAIGGALVGAVVLGLMSASRMSLPLASVGAEPATVPVLAAITGGIAAQASPGAVLGTTVVALAITALAIGLAWWWMARRQGGDLIRFIPYPVIGGFLGSVGWLMLTGGMGVAMAQGFTLAQAWAWITGAADLRLVVALGLGALIWWTLLRVAHVLTLPGLIVGSVIVLHLGLMLAGLDLEAARGQGWLLKPFSQTLPALPLAPDLLASVQWGLVAQQAGLMASAVIVATLALLLSDTSLEVAWDTRADINCDLRALGQANLVAGALGGLVGGVSISRSVLNRAAGAADKGSAVVLAVLCLLAMVWGGPVIALVPRPLLGAMLIYLGIGMLKAWVLDSRKRLPLRDYLTVIVMVAVTAVAGFLPAVCVGVLSCCLDFALSSASLSPVRRVVERGAWPSRVERSQAQMDHLRAQSGQQQIVELQGVLFFGSATRLVRDIEALLEGPSVPSLILLDLRQVRWVDTSAAQALGRLFKQAVRQGAKVELSGLSAAVRQALVAAGALTDGGPTVHADIDAAVQAWDDEVLSRVQWAPQGFDDWLRQSLPADSGDQAADLPRRLLAQVEPLRLAVGECLFRQGEPSDALYLLRSGRLVAQVQTTDAATGEPRALTVRTIQAGGAVGEMGLFRAVPRSATILADQPSELLCLRRERLAQMEREEPAVAAALYRLFLGQLAGRLDQLTAQATALAR